MIAPQYLYFIVLFTGSEYLYSAESVLSAATAGGTADPQRWNSYSFK